MSDTEDQLDINALVYALVKIIVSQVWFLDSCDDDVLDPRIALKHSEYIFYELEQLTPASRREIIASLNELATNAEASQPREYTHNDGYIKFVREFAIDLALEDEDRPPSDGNTFNVSS
jgi:hypothetical protein